MSDSTTISPADHLESYRLLLAEMSEKAIEERLRSSFGDPEMLPGTDVLLKLRSMKKLYAARDNLLGAFSSPAFLKQLSKDPTEFRRTLELLWEIEKAETEAIVRYAGGLDSAKPGDSGRGEATSDESGLGGEDDYGVDEAWGDE